MHLRGLHHITAIAADGKRNVDFYTRVLGLRLVKKTVNFDDPGTYHLYYGDQAASPGTILTFFIWGGLQRGRPGLGQASATAFAIPPGSLDFWRGRLKRLGIATSEPGARFGEPGVTLTDPDGLGLALTETAGPDPRRPARHPEIPTAHGIRGFHAITLAVASADQTAGLLTGAMGYRLAARDGLRARYTTGDGLPGTFVDLHADPALPRGLNGSGTVHHVAFRASDDAAQQAARSELVAGGYEVSPVKDRNYFHSIYYREPAGILFEIATDGPGFTVDESLEELGTHLKLPAWHEPQRAQIEAYLPRLD
jgi:glyoxalase family protein